MPAVDQHHYSEGDHQYIHKGCKDSSTPKVFAEPGFVLPEHGSKRFGSDPDNA